MLGDVRQIQKGKCCMITLKRGIRNRQIYEDEVLE